MKYTRLSHTRHRAPVRRKPQLHWKYRQQGVALAIALILLGVLMVFTALAATLMTSETRLSAAQYDNARTFNAGMASLELMTDRINTLFTSNFNPTAAEIAEASGSVPIFKDGSNDLFTFEQKVTQLGGGRALVTVLDPPFEGLTAKERLFRLETIAQDNQSQTQVRLIRDVANYQIPIFQFAVFGFDSLDVSPGPRLWLGGRTHTNRNLFLMVRQGGNRTEFYGKITTVGEVCTEILPSGRGVVSGESEPGRHRIYDKGTLSLRDIEPSVTNATGPDNPGVAASYDYNLVDDPSSPNGGIKTSGAQPSGLVVTGIPRLLLPTESKGFQAIEILRRAVPADEQPDNEALKNTRFFNGIFARYSTIRILLDDDLEEFPEAIGAEPRAYDLNDLADPTDPFWVALANNVAQFNPNVGNDHPDQAAGAVTVGQGNPVGGATVTPPQTNIINHQPEFQRLANGNVAPTRKHTYIKIELLINDKTPDPPTRIDITRHILNLGITAGPIPVINNGLNAVDLAGNNSTTSPDGRLRASTTYINSYPLNDTRLTNTAADNDLNSNMLPWLDNSTTAPNIGKYKAALGGGFPNSPALTLRTAGAKTATISYRFEPNAILRLQRTYFPYEPNNNIDVTTADVPTQSDAPAPITAINNPAGSTGRLADNYPAKFKSLIAKPYFRFTDQFDNFTYVKGTAKLNNGMFELVNPFAEFPNTDTPSTTDFILNSRQRVYAGNGTLANGTDTRFIRAIEVYGASCVTNNTNPGKPNTTGSFEITSSGPGGLLPFADNTDAFEPATGQLQGSRAKVNRDELFNLLRDRWNSDAALRQQLCQRIRENVFKPGIPGFYALAWDNNGTGSNAGGDGKIDLDVNWDPTPNTAENSDPRVGVIDLNEMTVFPNLDPVNQQPKLTAFRTNVGTLTANDFTHLSWPTTTLNPNINNIPSYLKEDPAAANNTFDVERDVLKFLQGLRDVEPGMTNPATAELPRENIVFDWNGDGLIEPPHRPFQGGTPSRNSTITEGIAVGYSVESNICSLIPSTLRVSQTPSTTADRVTSVPVEVRLVEQNGTVVWVDPANNNAALQSYVGTLMSNNGGQIPFSQADPDPGAGSGFTNNTNSFRIDVPFWTFQRLRTLAKTGTSYNYAITMKVRSAVRIVFQHPLAPRGLTAGSYPTPVGFATQAEVDQRGNQAQIGRHLGLTDAHYAFPGHCYMDFIPTPGDDDIPAGGVPNWLPRVRTKTDTAFPINIWDQREGRHISRQYGFQGIPTSADYHNSDAGTGSKRILDNQWPDWPNSGTNAADIENNERILNTMAQKLPMPSPIAFERRGMMNIVELDMGNLKRLFRGDFNNFLGNIGGGFTSGQPRYSPIDDSATIWGGNGIIDISDNGLIVYISDRRGDDNNDGLYEFNDVFGENGVLDELDNTVNTVLDPGSDQKGKPGDGIFRFDADVETQPHQLVVDDNSPPRTGESPHGSVPTNDGFEYFCGNIYTTTWRVTDPYSTPPDQDSYPALLRGAGIAQTMLGVTAAAGTAPAASQTGAVNWRIVDSAKTGRTRAFRRGVRIVNGWDIPRWYLKKDGPVPRHFTGMSLVCENPVYIYGNLNAIGVQEQPSTIIDPDSGLPVDGPTASRRFLQTGNRNMPLVPGDFNSATPVSGGADDGLLHGPMSIMADAVSIQSRAYQDARMFISQGGHSYRPQNRLRRYAMETTVKAAWLTGQPKAGVQTTSQQTIEGTGDSVDLNSGNSPNTQGGVHNFPRFCETWTWPTGQVRFNYNGSFIYQFYSQQGNGPWKIGGWNNASHYNAPPRNWNFDSAFKKLGGLPPGTPRVSFYKIRGFRQVFIEDQD